MKPEISIIVAVYNVEKYISACLESLIQQSFKDIEIICINDGSTDNSATILFDYAMKDNRVKVLTQENRGVACTRNKGLAMASGKYIMFVDADDWVNLDLCKRTYEIAERNQSDIVMYNVAFFDNKAQKITPGRFFDVKVWDKHVDENTVHTYKDCKSIFYGNLSTANKLYRRRFLEKIGVEFPEHTRFEDHSFHLETVFNDARINILDYPLYYYRQNRRNSMMTTLCSTKVVFDIFKIVDIVEEMLKRIGKFQDLKYLFFQFKYEAYAHYYMRVNFFSKAKYYKIMKDAFFEMYSEDYDFTICKKMMNFYNFTDILNYNWFVCYILKLYLDAPQKNRRKKFQPLKKFLESGMSEEASKYA